MNTFIYIIDGVVTFLTAHDVYVARRTMVDLDIDFQSAVRMIVDMRD